MMKMRSSFTTNTSVAVHMVLRNVLLPMVLVLAVPLAPSAAPRAAGSNNPPRQLLPEQYPSPIDHLDDLHRKEFMRVIGDANVTDDELSEAADYLQRVRNWADQVNVESPADASEAHKVVMQATWYQAAVQEAFGRIQTSHAVTQHDPRLVGDLLRRGFDDAAYGSALNWPSEGINSVVNGMDITDRGLMARVLSRVPAIMHLSAASVEQLRATLPLGSSEASAFAKRYPRR